MPTRIDIELTSAAADGSWTWRAAGAREPRGVLDGSLLSPAAAVGDHLKVETDHDMDGIRVTAIVTSKAKESRSGLLELLPAGEFEPVIQQRARRERSDRGGDRDGRPRRPGRDDRAGRGAPRGDRSDRGDRGQRDDRAPRGPRTDGGGERRDSVPREGGRGGQAGDDRRRNRPYFTPPPELPTRPKPKRLRAGKRRRGEVLASLPEEQRPVAELAIQGLAAVRQRVREDNVRLRAEGKPEMPESTVLKMAEDLLPRLRVADWLDRAEAAQRQMDQLDLRDLRSVVAAADDPVVARDETTRELSAQLKSALTTKQDEELALWLADVEAAVDVGRVVRALRASAMPPKAGVPFPGPLGAKLAQAASASLTADDPGDRWIAVLEATAFSPIRSQVVVSAAPTEPSVDLTATVKRLAPLLPQVAEVFGIAIPAKARSPKPLRPTPRKREGSTTGAGAGSAAVLPPPPPPRPPRVADADVTVEQPADVSELVEVVEAVAPEVPAVTTTPGVAISGDDDLTPDVVDVSDGPDAEPTDP